MGLSRPTSFDTVPLNALRVQKEKVPVLNIKMPLYKVQYYAVCTVSVYNTFLNSSRQPSSEINFVGNTSNQ
jgi:hypothetical protein